MYTNVCFSANIDEGPPRIVSFPAQDFDGEKAVANHLRIECKGTGKSTIKYNWKKFRIDDRNREETLSPGLRVETDGSLVSTYLLPSDDGHYQCFASNSLGTTFSRKVKVKVKCKFSVLTVHFRTNDIVTRGYTRRGAKI